MITTKTRVSSRSKDKLLKPAILSKEEEARLAREKKAKMDEIKLKYSRKMRSGSRQSRGS